MPLMVYEEYFFDYGRLAVWNASEPTPKLLELAMLDDARQQQFDQIRLDKRKREWLCTQILLHLVAPGKSLSTLANGKPMLSHGLHISISHCDTYAAVLVADRNIGMDLQRPDEKLQRISSRFCSPSELGQLPPRKLLSDHLTVIWSAKEAVFKFFGEKVTFASDITVHPFHARHSVIRADYKGVHGEKRFELSHVRLNDYHILIAY